MKYRKMPVVIDAWELKYDTDCINDLLAIIGDAAHQGPDGSIKIKTLEGVMTAVTGDYIIKGVHGEFYPCKPDIFKETYEEVQLSLRTRVNMLY